jgi:hypothetical protein
VPPFLYRRLNSVPKNDSRLKSLFGCWRELWATITGNFLKGLSGNPPLQIGVFTDTALVKERHYLLRLQV